jgi:hypothetical protein
MKSMPNPTKSSNSGLFVLLIRPPPSRAEILAPENNRRRPKDQEQKQARLPVA